METLDIFNNVILVNEKIIDFDFNNQETAFINTNEVSTSQRVLLSPEWQGTEKQKFYTDYYSAIDGLSEIIYEIYHSDSKQLNNFDSKSEFNNYIKQNRAVKDLFWQSSYWEYDSAFSIIRKESIKLIPRKGRFYEKEFINDSNTLDGQPYTNAEKIHPTHLFNEIEENDQNKTPNYNWIFGKYDIVDPFNIRFYWNFIPDKEILVRFLSKIQDLFDNNNLPFEFKFLSNPKDYNNYSDVGVLYVPRKNFLMSIELVKDIQLAFNHSSFFCEKSPLFTKYLAKGLSFGDNPDDSRYSSFGKYRSIRIAMSISEFRYSENKMPNGEELVQKINEQDSEWTSKFYFNEFSKIKSFSSYEIALTTFRNQKIFLPNIADANFLIYKFLQNTWFDRLKYLRIAVNIANILCKEAIWYEVNENEENNQQFELHCNWISYSKSLFLESETNEAKKNKQVGYEFKALDESFADGRLGIAFFLNQIQKICKEDSTFKSTSYGAIAGALSQANINPIEINWFSKNIVMDTKIGNRINNTLNINQVEPFIQNIEREKSAWRTSNFTLLIDKVITIEKYDLTYSDRKIINEILVNYFEVNRPFGNALGTNEFCATLKDGYAYLGYFFLRLYYPNIFPALPFTIINDDF